MDDSDSNFDPPDGACLDDDAPAPADVDHTGEGELRRETDHMRSPGRRSLRDNSPPYPHRSTSSDGEIDAKNKTIAALQEKLKYYEQVLKMSRSQQNSGDDWPDGRHTSQTNFSNHSARVSTSSRQFSNDADTSNSTDAEKLTQYMGNASNTLILVKERDRLQDRLSKAFDEIESLKRKVSEGERLRMDSDASRKDIEALNAELLKKNADLTMQLENVQSEVGMLKQHMEEHSNNELQLLKERYQKNELKFKEEMTRMKQELESVHQERRSLQERLDDRLAEDLSASAFNPEAQAVAELEKMIEALCKELKETATTVQQQSAIIRRLKNAAGSRHPFQMEEEEESGFRARSHGHTSSSPDESSHTAAEPTNLPVNSSSSTMNRSSQVCYPPDDDTKEMHIPSEEDLYSASRSQLRREGPGQGHRPGGLGHFQGPTQGHFQGHFQGHSVGPNQGHSQGPTQGFTQGHGQGSLQGIVPTIRNSGAFDLDSYEESLNSRQSRSAQQAPSVNYPIRETFPGPPANLPSATPATPVEHSDSGGDGQTDRPKVCPMCNVTQPRGTTMDMFQTHVLECMGQAEVSGEETMTEQVCPVCSYLCPPGTSQHDFEAHVNSHFENMTFASPTDSFGTQQ